ncbi:MAG: hypothetical protein ACOYWZ_07155 [Bacillota bacterium]
MGTSFTSYNDKHIRSKDYKIEVWLLLLCKEIGEMSNAPEWLEKAKTYWFEHAKDHVNGVMDPCLDEFITDNSKLQLFLELCKKVYSSLLGFGEKISADYINNLYGYEKTFDYRIREDNLTELYLSYGRFLIKLLEGKQENEVESV